MNFKVFYCGTNGIAIYESINKELKCYSIENGNDFIPAIALFGITKFRFGSNLK
jgi:hypothetical protein